MEHIRCLKFILILMLVTLNSCGLFIEGYKDYSAAKKYYKERSYHNAALYAFKSLKQNARNRKALVLFESSYKLAIEEHMMNIVDLQSIEDGSKWPELFYKYNDLQKLNDALLALEPIIKIELNYHMDIPSKDYEDDLERIRPLAAEFYYAEGLEYGRVKNKESQKLAAKAFKLSMQFDSDFKNSNELYNKARSAALITLLVLPFEGDDNLVDYIRDRMMMAQTSSSKEFLQVLTRDELSTILLERNLVQAGITQNNYLEIGELSGADHILSASLTIAHRPVETISVKNINQEKKIVIREEKYIDEEGLEKINKIKKKVRAYVDHHKKSAESNLRLLYRITDINNESVVYSGSVKSSAKFFHEWATHGGDKKALSSKYKSLVRKQEKFAPSVSELNLKAAKTLPEKLMDKISKHYYN